METVISQVSETNFCQLSETHYSLKEMETLKPVLSVTNIMSCRKPTTLWKRWKPSFLSNRQKLLNNSRKPTTLWKRWKLVFSAINFVSNLSLSETHYSLKEMETRTVLRGRKLHRTKSETHYSLKEMETPLCEPYGYTILHKSETHYSLKEMETRNNKAERSRGNYQSRKPTTLWKRWKQ